MAQHSTIKTCALACPSSLLLLVCISAAAAFASAFARKRSLNQACADLVWSDQFRSWPLFCRFVLSCFDLSSRVLLWHGLYHGPCAQHGILARRCSALTFNFNLGANIFDLRLCSIPLQVDADRYRLRLLFDGRRLHRLPHPLHEHHLGCNVCLQQNITSRPFSRVAKRRMK